MGSSRGTTVSCGLYRETAEKHTHALITDTEFNDCWHRVQTTTSKAHLIKDTKSNVSSIKLLLTASSEQKQTGRNPINSWPCLLPQTSVCCAASQTVMLQQRWIKVKCVETRQSSRGRTTRSQLPVMCWLIREPSDVMCNQRLLTWQQCSHYYWYHLHLGLTRQDRPKGLSAIDRGCFFFPKTKKVEVWGDGQLWGFIWEMMNFHNLFLLTKGHSLSP